MNRNLVRFGALSLALVVAGQAGAVTRIRSDLNTCATVRQTVDKEGSAVVRYPSKRVSNYFLSDRYESPNLRCPWGEKHVAHTVPTKDNPSCVVYNCEVVEPLFEDMFGRH